MISVTLKFQPSTADLNEGILYYQIVYRNISRYLVTDYKIRTSEWNIYSGNLELGQTNILRHNYLSSIMHKIEWDKRRLHYIYDKLLYSNKAFTTDDIVYEFKGLTSEITLFNYMRNMVDMFWRRGQYRTSETYSSTLNSFSEFRNGIDLYFEDINTDLLLAYEYYLKSKSLSPNTISFYMKRLRAVYNKAVDEGYAESRNLFRRVFTSSEKTVKRAISINYIKRLKKMDLSHSPSKEFARDMFLFSFYTRGMSFIDIAYLQEKDLRGKVLTYRRKKTGQLLSIQWENCMQEIVNKYSSSSISPFLLPIIRDSGGNLRKQYQNVQSLINRNLKNIGVELKLPIPLTMYVARHSWASVARSEGIPISVISEGMGHDSEATTQIYLASLETQVIDKANHKILKLL